MKIYNKYIKDVLSGKQLVGELMLLAVKRFERMRNNPEIYFDEDEVDGAIDFFSQMKHFLGKSAGTNFILEPWQQFIVAAILGLK